MAIYLKITNPTEVVKKKTSKWLTDITPERIDRKLVEDEVIKGIRFENHCMEILKQNGWEVKETPNTGDQGVDLIASINDLRICIQCKDHEKAIGNKAVQEISAGKLFWKGTHAIIVSKSGFTKSAHQLAKSNKVELINEFQLKDLEKFIV